MAKNKVEKQGFTLIELIVVVAVMVTLTSAMVLNLNSTRASRNIKIAQNELVSNIRKTQSYVLSSRTLSGGQSVQYYLLKFDLSKPTQYKIQAMYNTNSSPQYLQDVEIINFPPNIKLSGFSVTRSNNPVNQAPTPCALVSYSAPFGKVILNDGCTIASPPNIAAGDDYKKIIDFVSNIDCTIYGTPPACTASTDSIMTITLSSVDGSLTKTVTVNGITGGVSFN